MSMRIASLGGALAKLTFVSTMALALAPGRVLAAPQVSSRASSKAAPQFYFQVVDVEAGPEVDEATKTFAHEAVQAELASRREWASDIEASTTDALVAELQRRKLRGFSVTVRFEGFKKEVKEPSGGARRKRVAVDVRLSVFGTTIPEAKLSFSGEGEAATEAEVPDKGLEIEGAALAKDVIKDAIKQAVDQAVMKLSLGNAKPMNEHRHAAQPAKAAKTAKTTKTK
ncbi:MAG: hypothetical protein JWM82_3900 [Myxococcales bacterium]|nr:hypothetical protein [Myxococcales bacterium]